MGRAWLLSGMGALALGIAPLCAGESPIDVPAQPLASALSAVAGQTGINILFDDTVLDGMRAPRVHGRMSAYAAVTALIGGLPLEVVPDGNGGLLVRRTVPRHAQPVSAPAARDGAANIEQIEVSASRISLAGYRQPTPVTTLDADQLERDSYQALGDALRALPSIGSSASPNNGLNSGVISGAQAGIDSVNLRNLGILRTLVLVDGQRVVPSNITGGVDLRTIPTSMVRRVDVVTGDASAAWGSDAVAGVINLVLDKEFTGFKANIEGGDSTKDDHRSYKIEASWGGDFGMGRGHLTLSGSYSASPDAVFQAQRGWYNDTYLMANPAYAPGNGQPRLIHARNVGLSQAVPGGVITSGPLRGTAFEGPQATVVPFDFGHVSGGLAYGGDANFYTGESAINLLAMPHDEATLFGYARYRLTNSITLSMQLNYGHSWSENDTQTTSQLGTLAIRADNAYLPSTVRKQMAALDITSFLMGTTNSNNVDFTHMSLSAASRSLGVPVNNSYRQLMRGVFSLDGVLGDGWSWRSYYQHGTARVALRVSGNPLNGNYLEAVDAVRVTPENRGNSGFAVGSIVCRSSLTDPDNGCVPLDVFGTGLASPAAIAYVSPGTDYENIVLTQDMASATVQGTLPWNVGGGPLAMALGAEYRKEGGRIRADPLGASVSWGSGNFTDFAGHFDVAEGFAEINAPLLRNTVVRSLDASAAGRLTGYSTTGIAQTWRLGITGQVDDSLGLRASWSAAVRAPNLSELFDYRQINVIAGIDPKTGAYLSLFTNRTGNPDLKPEQAMTLSGGVVLTPQWFAGLRLSADWYAIDISRAIYIFTGARLLELCGAGIAVFCGNLVYGGADGTLSQVNTEPGNADSETVSGLDFQADYAVALGPGDVAVRLIGNYTDEETLTLDGIAFDYAGSLGPDSLVSGMPKFRAVVSASYNVAGWSGTVQGRFFGTGRLDNHWRTGVDVDDNAIPAVAYLDLRASFQWGEHAQLYGAIDDALNIPPPTVAPSYRVGIPYQYLDTRTDIYDALGRAFRIGLRIAY